MSKKMKALVYEGPEELIVKEVPIKLPQSGEVLLKIKSCGICGSDVHGYLGITGRRLPPLVMGHEFAGEIAELGADLKHGFAIGERVTVQPVDFCGKCENCRQGYTNVCTDKRFFGVHDVDGAFEEYLCVPEKLLYQLPDTFTFNDGALIEAMAVAYCGVKKAGDLKGKNVLIVGGGTIGQMALTIVRSMGPKNIILSDLSEFRRTAARKNGADFAFDPQQGDFVAAVKESLGGDLIDVAIEAVGIGATVNQALSVLKPRGICVWIGNSAKTIELDMQKVVTNEIKIYGTYIYTHVEFGETIDFIVQNRINLIKLITRSITLSQTPEMFRELVTATEKYLKVVVEFD